MGLFVSFKELLIDFFVPSNRNNFLPRALSGRSFFYYGFLILLVNIMLFSPLTQTLPWRVFLANLSQEMILSDVNPERTQASVPLLKADPLLSEAARMKAEDMIARDYFSHIGPNGELPWKWIKALGYEYAAAGENLAIDFSDPNALVNAWMASPTHAANIKNGIFTDVGIGVAEGTFQGRETAVVVMFLGKKASTTVAVIQTPPSSPAPVPTTVISAPVNVPAPVPKSAPIKAETISVDSAPVNTQAIRPDVPSISEKVALLPSENNNPIELERPLVVRIEPVEPQNIVEEKPVIETVVSGTTQADEVKANTLSLIFVKAPILLRSGLSLFFVGMFIFGVLMFISNKTWAPFFLSRASALMLLSFVLWLPDIF